MYNVEVIRSRLAVLLGSGGSRVVWASKYSCDDHLDAGRLEGKASPQTGFFWRLRYSKAIKQLIGCNLLKGVFRDQQNCKCKIHRLACASWVSDYLEIKIFTKLSEFILFSFL